jgi:hypothetical protein
MKFFNKIQWKFVLHTKYLQQATGHTCKLWIARN